MKIIFPYLSEWLHILLGRRSFHWNILWIIYLINVDIMHIFLWSMVNLFDQCGYNAHFPMEYYFEMVVEP
jgi:hypothetical protein